MPGPRIEARTNRQAFFLLLLLLTFGITTNSRAEVATLDALFDLDQDPATGCTVNTVDGDAEGVDLRIRTLFDVGQETVLSTTASDCVDPILDLFGAETPIATAPQPAWPGVVGNGTSGSMLVEAHIPLAVTGAVAEARAFVVVTSLVGEDAMLDTNGSESLLIGIFAPPVPGLGFLALGALLAALWMVTRAELNKRTFSRVVAWGLVMHFVMLPVESSALLGEGFHRTWTLDEVIGSDPAADAPAGIDLLEFSATFDSSTQELWLRFDIMFGSPVCVGWGTVDPGVGYACGMQPPLDSGPFGGAIAMTFDDGPHEVVTPLVLATLRAHGIPATFFVVGNRLVTPGERALALEIHQDPLFRIANHSLTHVRMTQLTAEQIDVEVTANSDLIRDAIGDPCYFPRYFRFPFAASNCTTMEASRRHGFASAAVHINTSDWCYGTNGGSCPASVVPFIEDEFRDDLPGWAVNQFEQSGGGILVMHDIHTNTAAELPAVIAGLQAAGATFVDLDDPLLFPIMNGTISTPEAPSCCEGITN